MRNLLLPLLLASLCGLFSTIRASGAPLDLNRTLFTPGDDQLPEGAYIITGVSGLERLADYLVEYPETRITRLLISDSSAEEIDAGGSLEDDDTKLKVGRVVHATQRVLDKAAPSMEVLTYLTYIWIPYDPTTPKGADPRLAALLGRDYPSLRRLSFGARHLRDPHPVLDQHSLFPALTHLHIFAVSSLRRLPTLAALLADFPELTHLRLSGAQRMDDLLAELDPPWYQLAPQGWAQYFHAFILRAPRPFVHPEVVIPGNLTVIVEPGPDPMLRFSTDDMECGTPNIEYNDLLTQLAAAPGVHLKLPFEDSDVSFFRRAVAEFEDQARGGEGEWAIPERAPRRDEL